MVRQGRQLVRGGALLLNRATAYEASAAAHHGLCNLDRLTFVMHSAPYMMLGVGCDDCVCCTILGKAVPAGIKTGVRCVNWLLSCRA